MLHAPDLGFSQKCRVDSKPPFWCRRPDFTGHRIPNIENLGVAGVSLILPLSAEHPFQDGRN